MDHLSDKEEWILHRIAVNSLISQRELARVTGMSLGLTNVIIKRLIKNGYLKISQKNKRKFQYDITSEGRLESVKGDHEHTLSTIRSYRKIESSIHQLFKKLYESGYRYFSIYGDGELREFVQSIFYRSLEEAPVTLGQELKDDPSAVILNISMESPESNLKGTVVNVLEKITQM
ncbi:MAG: winged helix-turn-helix transcriptional regulator [Deltaproteobacteria bacterium]|nr:winged helix-turn-helix transcriptional regulator [Deltaproteobacteria bacterium]